MTIRATVLAALLLLLFPSAALAAQAAPDSYRSGGLDLDCEDFSDDEKPFELPGADDPHRLDADDDGVACESGTDDGTHEDHSDDDDCVCDDDHEDTGDGHHDQVRHKPKGGVQTGAGGTAQDDGGLVLLGGAAALAVLVIAGRRSLARR